MKPRLRLAFFGDDFTGSTDGMEALARASVPTVLFLAPPRPEQLARFPDAEVVGVAGVSRSLPTAEMEAELRPVFTALRDLGAPLVHYKICSTFDSSPMVGSIGRAMEVGRDVFASPFVPLVVGAPVLGRYCVFGNLFARSGPETEPFRLDRHPTMRSHPVTPMDEADLRVHLARQTNRSIGLFDVLRLDSDDPDARLAELLASHPEIVLFDTLTNAHLRTIGRLLEASRFVVGSSGVEYGLAAHWRATGLLPEPPVFFAPPVEQIIVASGSCSPVTERQIDWATEHGFAEVVLQPERFANPDEARAEHERAAHEALTALAHGRNVVLHTSKGPSDPRIAATRRRLEATGVSSAALLGRALGDLLGDLLLRTGIRRACVTGGDTSGYVARALGVEALEMAAPMAPGSPLCRVRADGFLDGVEIVFKGGQVGATDLFERVRSGRP